MFKFARVMGMTLGVAVQAMLGGMPVPRDLHRDDVDGQVIITVGSAVLFSYDAADAGLRNLAAVTLPEMGFTGRRVAHVLGITEVYVSMLRTRARAEGSAGLMHRRGRPAALGARDLGRARSWRGEGVTDTAIGKRLGVHGSTVARALVGVEPCTPRRFPIAVSVTPSPRQERARPRSRAPRAVGRPRRRVSPAEPSARARARSIDTYSWVIPSTRATRRPVKPI